MAAKNKASILKKRKSIILEKLSDNSNNNNNSDKDQNSKSLKKKMRSRQQLKIHEENNQEKKLNNFPTKNIFHPKLFFNDEEFLKRFKCGLCEYICENPRFQYCGCEQVYCQKCLKIYYDCYHNQCPKCQNETKELIPFDNYVESLMNLKMKCSNYTMNCNWVGLYKDYKEHITENCPKEIINCPKKDCIYKLPREDMPNHISRCEYRDYICRDCLTKMPFFQKRTHKNYCPKAKMICPQGCGEIIEREEISEHKKECMNSEISCPFKIFGCPDKFQRCVKDERLSKDTSKHLHLTAKVVFELKNQITLKYIFKSHFIIKIIL